MLGKDLHNWATMSGRGSIAESASHRAQFAKLDRHAALTIIRAPTGYGKSALIASWLRTTHVSELISVWISASDRSVTAREYWAGVLAQLYDAGIALVNSSDTADPDPFAAIVTVLCNTARPVVIVLIRPDRVAGTLDDEIIDIATICRNVSVVVTVTGRSMFPDPHLLDIDQESISTNDLLFTLEDTTSFLDRSGAEVHPGEAELVQALVGGLPVLVHRSVAALKNLPRDSGREQLLEHRLRQVLEHYTQEFTVADARRVEQYDFLVSTAAARSLTVGIAMQMFDSHETTRQIHDRLLTLESAGVLCHIDTEIEATWSLPPAIRQSILSLQNGAGIDQAQRLSFLAHRQLDAGNHASALDYAVEAKDWPLSVDIIEQHWVSMIADNLETVRSAFHQIPPEAADKKATAQAGRNLFMKHQAQHSGLASVPTSQTELSTLGRSADAKAALTVGCVQALEFIHVGEYQHAAEVTGRLIHVSQSALESNPDEISAQLPIMRAQWAVTYQLTGRFAESTTMARMAYWGGVAQGLDFVARNSAGIVAMNWAMAGEPHQARYWSEFEQKHRDSNDRLEPLIKTAGLTARTLASLDTLDYADARQALTELGHPTESQDLWAEELWAFAIYAHSQFALAHGDAFSALSLLRRTVAARRAQCNPTSFAQPLMRATEIDLLLALGEGTQAVALADSIADPENNPWTLVSVARIRQRIGHNEAAIALCHQFDWSGESYPRAHTECLLIQAVAHLELGDQQRAAEAWSMACSIADQTGLLRPFTTIATPDIEKLESTAITTSSALAEFVKSAGSQSFPKSVHIVALTGRERRVLSLLALGMSSTGMADRLHVSTNTVKSQLRSLYKKLDAHSRDEALAKAHALQFI
ncbi:LuxR family transcriptional regulator [Rhodococcus sp. ABRD24]|uniref:LuxR family transcriptional regulator n=1 Tax=Rhodococcus sp. ABRD24 TaxID=2507582 RepID=UPI00103A092F|nr:LuxR family transcriptional regulator [Rhodococcus sp. ABRD24]QBJ98422.1 LuxR family transcriptional regulator [Rhodococcus sp. ABRD24]